MHAGTVGVGESDHRLRALQSVVQLLGVGRCHVGFRRGDQRRAPDLIHERGVEFPFAELDEERSQVGGAVGPEPALDNLSVERPVLLKHAHDCLLVRGVKGG